MNNVMIRRFGVRVLVGAALFLAQMSPLTLVAPAAQPLGDLTQFCASSSDEPVEAPRVYCHQQGIDAPA